MESSSVRSKWMVSKMRKACSRAAIPAFQKMREKTNHDIFGKARQDSGEGYFQRSSQAIKLTCPAATSLCCIVLQSQLLHTAFISTVAHKPALDTQH